MYSNLIIFGSSERTNRLPYSYAECIQIEYIKDLLPIKIENLIKNFVKNNWNELNDNNELIDNGWRAENIDIIDLKFDIYKSGDKKGEGYIYHVDWAKIKRI